MTLIVSAATWYGTAQCSDRLVSAGGRLFDAQSNKTVLCFAPDAIAAISYSGTAFIDRTHTDTWIVEQILRRRFSGKEKQTIMLSGTGAVPRIGPMVGNLGGAIQRAFSNRKVSASALNTPFEIALCGWTWRLPRRSRSSIARPFIWVLRRDAVTGTVMVARSRRYPRREPQRKPEPKPGSELITLITPNAHGNLLGRGSIWRRLVAKDSPESIDAEFVACIRDAAALQPSYIGRNCMLVKMPQPGNRIVTVKYFPDPMTVAPEAGDSTRVAYSPWVIDSDLVFPPSEHTMGTPSTLLLGAWTVEYTFEGAGESHIGGTIPQRRRGL